jgi:excisionase family DNA binding protein
VASAVHGVAPLPPIDWSELQRPANFTTCWFFLSCLAQEMESRGVAMQIELRDSQQRYDELDKLLTVQELAGLLHVPASWIYERTRRRGVDRLPFVKLGKYVRFERTAVQIFLAKQRNSS